MNSLNRDMNQQNKTEGWEVKLEDLFSTKSAEDGGHYLFASVKEVKTFISQLLSDARREERNNIEDTTKALLKDVAYQAQIRGYSTNDWYFKGQQNAYQQILTILSQSQSDQSLTTAEERIKNLPENK